MKGLKVKILFLYLVLPFLASAGFETDSLLNELKVAENDSIKLDVLVKLSKFYHRIYPDKALEYAEKALEISLMEDNKKWQATCLNLIGIVYDVQGKYNKALEYYFNALKINEVCGDKKEVAKNLNNIGIVYDLQGNHKHALEYYFKSIEIKKQIQDFTGVAYSYLNISVVYEGKGSLDSSKIYLNNAIEIIEKSDNKKAKATVYNNAGLILAQQKKYVAAKEYFESSYELKEKMNDVLGMISGLQNIGECYHSTGYFQTALKYYEKSVDLAEQLNSWYDLMNASEKISEAYEELGNLDLAYQYYEKYSNYKDSIQDEKNQKKIAELRTKYETEKKDDEIELLNKEKRLNKLILEEENEKAKKQSLIIYGVLIGGGIVSILVIILLIQFRQKKRKNILLQQQNIEIVQKQEKIKTQHDEIIEQRDEIEAQRDIATVQRDLITVQTKEITDSIKYAFRIQNALLPPDGLVRQLLPMSFIYFKPRDLVSGDFYWVEKKDENILVVAADCTGHGVPGAFMSMLGIAFFNELISKKQELIASEILDELKELVIRSLNQTGKSGESKDGMDVALCIINKRKRSLQYAGANNSIYIISKESNESLQEFYKLQPENKQTNLYEIKADKMPVGIHYVQSENHKFSNHLVKLNPKDEIFMFSDGFADQFGGESGKKYMFGKFKSMLMKVYDYSMDEQKKYIDDEYESWVSNNGKKYTQVDDILVLGLKV